MSNFTTAAPKRLAVKPNKRVNYSLGLVLGVDEFEQEQTYFLERDRQHNRSLHGYGTVCGLNVTVNGSEINVSPGLAVDPRGRVIQVSQPQCGSLDEWLSVQANRDAVGAQGAAQLYVVLCYRECKTNKVPIPGAPCRSEEDTMDYARISETFELQFKTLPPQASEEAAVRAFGDLLARVQVNAGGAGPFVTKDDMVDLVRDLLSTSPIGSPISAPLWLRPEDAETVLSAAFRVWITEVRPALPGGESCATSAGPEECVLLAQLNFEIDLDWKVAPAPVPGDPALMIDENERPLLLHTRLLQEWLLRSISGAELNAAGDVTGALSDTIVQGLQKTPLSPAAPANGQVLTFDAGQWSPANLPALPALTGDVTGAPDANTVEKIRGAAVAPTAPADGQVLRFTGGQWQPEDLPAGGGANLAGDVTGAPGTNTVERLRGRTVAATAPTNGQVLRFSSSQWRPFTPPNNFVNTPAALPPYHIIAAGILGTGGSRAPLYDPSMTMRLTNGAENGLVLLRFNSYQQPSGSHFYIVKAVVVADKAARAALNLTSTVVLLDSFTPDGILLWVAERNQPVDAAIIKQMEFMVEISFYKA